MIILHSNGTTELGPGPLGYEWLGMLSGQLLQFQWCCSEETRSVKEQNQEILKGSLSRAFWLEAQCIM